MRYVILFAILVSLICSMPAMKKVPATDKEVAAGLEEKLVQYFVLKTRLSGNHPTVQQLRNELAGLASAGGPVDLSRLESMLDEAYLRHKELSSQFSQRHPEVVQNLEKLAIIAKLLSYDSQHLQENWDRIADKTF
ncbi:MAG: hypothetical protein KatS3mg111_1659 [Pirellulaceae bacterium]|nr:MAG: hypothetical protein KatS3mg111_1659 [Pirellulaceae bacterium]